MRRQRAPLRFLVTAGPTREYIDPVRYISNESSGRMGFAVATAAAARGHAVTLIHGPVALAAPPVARVIPVVSAAEMLAACRKEWPRSDVLVMVAAVADYTPVRALRRKRQKSSADLALRLKPTVDILALLAKRRRPTQVVIGFALESHAGRRNAAAKLARKQLDAIVLNAPTALSSTEAAWQVLVRDEPWRSVPAGPKTRFAVELIRFAERLAISRSVPSRPAHS